MAKQYRNRGTRGILLVTTSLLFTSPALAQADSPESQPAVGEQQPEQRLEEIVVTAQKRSENLQTVPISITAVTAEKLEAIGVAGMQDMNLITPSLNFAESAGNVQPTLRGVGAVVGAGSESSVTTYIDGVYLAAASSSLFSLSNIERIEVLKGPQGTLFGRNSTGGVIQIITRAPSSTPHVEASVGYGNFATLETNFYGTSGLAPGLAADVVVHYKTQGDGWGINLADGGDANKTPRDLSIRSKIVYDNGHNMKITLAGDYANIKSDTFLSFRPVPGTLPLLKIPFPSQAGYWDINSEGGHLRGQELWGVSLKAERDLGFANLVSISAYRKTHFHTEIDADGTAILGVKQFINDDQRQMSQEFQIISPSSSRIKWIAGLYYFHNESKLDPLDTTVGSALTGLPGPIVLHNLARQTVSSLAGFGQVTVPIGVSTNLTAGFRYTYDWRKADNSSQTVLLFAPSASAPATIYPKRRNEDGKPTWRLAIDHSFRDGFLVYASYNRGFRSGVLPITQPTAAALEPEIVDAYEVGAKIDAFDRHLRINVAGFLTNSKNLQLNSYRNGIIAFFNAAAAKAYGADVEITAIPFEGLTLNGSLGWVHSRYTDFPNAPGTIPNVDPVTGALTGGNTAIIIPNAKGNTTIRTPTITASFSATYETELAGGELSLTGTLYHNSGWYPEVDNRLKQRAYQLLSGQIAWTAPGGHYRISFWGRNLTNVRYADFITEQTALDGLGAAEPRTYGVTAGFKF